MFNDFVAKISGVIPDPNAVTVINSAYKRKFYMIFKASCFVTSASCGNISQNGMSALVARQFGFLIGMRSKDCAAYPSSVMCRDPSDSQWSAAQQGLWSAAYSNILETILNNPNYYQEAVPPSGSL